MTAAARRIQNFRAAAALALFAVASNLVAITAAAPGTSPTITATAKQDIKPTADTEPFPIAVQASPALVVILSKGGNKSVRKVKISGTTIPLGQRPVTIVIKSDDLPPMTKTLVPGEDGTFSFTEFAPLEDGDYDITATAPDGRGEATTKLIAIELEDLEDKVDATLAEAETAAEDGVAEADKKIADQAESPAKQEAKKKIAAARNALKEISAKRPALRDAMRGLIGAIAANGAMAEVARPGIDRLSNGLASAEAETKRVKDLTSRMSGADVGCHKLAVVTEVFKTISALLNIKRQILDTAIGLAKDVTSDAAANIAKAKGAGPTFAFATGQVVKNLPELNSASKLSGNAYGIMADVGAYVTDQVFSAYCEQFTGPVSAVMSADFYWPTKEGPTLWWSYYYSVTGRLVLYYPKSAKGESIALKGRIEGYAHGFHTWENSLNVQFPKLMAGAIQHKRDWPPLEIGGGAAQIASQGASPLSAYVEGSAGGLAAPNSFLINVDGVLEKDSLSIVVGSAVSDFKAKHRVGVLILSPLTGGLGPQLTWYELPFLGAHHLFTRGTNDQAAKLKLVTEGKVMTAEGTVTNKVEKPKAKAQYKITLKACNPGC
ncbi:MAG: hypothetical protein K8S25_11205 [Alphaproteobacteria bacterium]|nr:hypothetical protein [Alphaproteobacteria bacterium]